MTTIDAQYAGSQNAFVRGWNAFTVWRRSRPFWAGLWTLIAALELWSIPFLSSVLTQHTLNLSVAGIAGISTMAMTPMMIVMAFAIWFAPDYRVFAGVFTIICGLLSMVVSNFGGFVFGMLFAVLGGALAFSWSPRLTEEQVAAQERAAKAYRAALTDDTSAKESPNPVDAVADNYLSTLADPKPAQAELSADGFAPVGSTSFPQVAPTLPQNRPSPSAAPLADALKQQRTASDSVPTATASRAEPSQDTVPPLPSAEDTPLGA